MVVLSALFLVGCNSIPNPNVDSFVRTMRQLDKAQRPNGKDLPMERFLAWQTRRDTNQAAPPELTQELQVLAQETHGIVIRIDQITPHTEAEKTVLTAYRAAHERARVGLEKLLDQRKLKITTRSEKTEEQLVHALEAIRAARALRKDHRNRLGAAQKHD
jgi:hypothetical protein